MNTHTTQPAPLPGTVVDGIPHITYYIREEGLSFVWTGNEADPIHVQAGGYGEPTVEVLNPRHFLPPWHMAPVEVLAWFKTTCDTWAAAKEHNARAAREEAARATRHAH